MQLQKQHNVAWSPLRAVEARSSNRRRRELTYRLLIALVICSTAIGIVLYPG